ncbi:MAG: hypothetical protein FWH08_00175 [Oscillospiraceae bacterium]|nr:hypothetical protein [Oscillospiraceae bacterium]
MDGLFGFLKSACARCGANAYLYKISDHKWLCLDCLKEGEYKSSWTDIKTGITQKYDADGKDNDAVYAKLIKDADELFKSKILLESGKITKEEYDEKLKSFFAD